MLQRAQETNTSPWHTFLGTEAEAIILLGKADNGVEKDGKRKDTSLHPGSFKLSLKCPLVHLDMVELQS